MGRLGRVGQIECFFRGYRFHIGFESAPFFLGEGGAHAAGTVERKRFRLSKEPFQLGFARSSMVGPYHIRGIWEEVSGAGLLEVEVYQGGNKPQSHCKKKTNNHNPRG